MGLCRPFHFLLPVFLSLPAAAGAQDSAGEYEVKAAFLYNFAIHVEWPAGAFKGQDSALVIGVFGKDPFDGALKEIVKGKSAQGKTLRAVAVERMEDLKQCHIVFVPRSERKEIGRVGEALKGEAVLVVGESPGLLREGAAMNFYLEGQRVRFEVSMAAVKRAGLKVGAKLLKIAKVVQDSE